MLKPQNNFCRTLILLNGIWDYSKVCDTPERGFTPQGKLAVPASWNEQHNELYHHKGRLWYQYRFTVPPLYGSAASSREKGAAPFCGTPLPGRVFLQRREAGRRQHRIDAC